MLFRLTGLRKSTRFDARELLLRARVRIDGWLRPVLVPSPAPPGERDRNQCSKKREPAEPVDDRQHDERARRLWHSQRCIRRQDGSHEHRGGSEGWTPLLTLERDPYVGKPEWLDADVPCYQMVESDGGIAEHRDEFFAAQLDWSNAVLGRGIRPRWELEAHKIG